MLNIDGISFHILEGVLSVKNVDFAPVTGFKFGSATDREREYIEPVDISKHYFGGKKVVARRSESGI